MGKIPQNNSTTAFSPIQNLHSVANVTLYLHCKNEQSYDNTFLSGDLRKDRDQPVFGIQRPQSTDIGYQTTLGHLLWLTELQSNYRKKVVHFMDQ